MAVLDENVRLYEVNGNGIERCTIRGISALDT